MEHKIEITMVVKSGLTDAVGYVHMEVDGESAMAARRRCDGKWAVTPARMGQSRKKAAREAAQRVYEAELASRRLCDKED